MPGPRWGSLTNNGAATRLAVNGTLDATNATFDTSRRGPSTHILVNPGGIIAPTGSTFNLPLYVPYNDVASLAAGDN